MTFCVIKKEFVSQTCICKSDGNMNSKKLECFDDDDSVDGKPSLSFLGKLDINKYKVNLCIEKCFH